MAPKPATVARIVLAMALTILTAMASHAELVADFRSSTFAFVLRRVDQLFAATAPWLAKNLKSALTNL
jgi:hypothetical protein